ncbi:MAG: RNA polymerase sigma factor [Oscillospiraceae bacterium]|nr:RNA polymerase sigma factor [Oscillospiraceae bacterium]MBQ9110929.1 RNA polymerase sigma factor [Oscillospiraceae bacterium]
MERVLDSYLRYLNGDQDGLRDIVELYWNSMLLFTNGYVHNLSEAEDISQEALIKLSIKRPKFEHESQLKAYLFTICRNRSLNYLKRQGRMQNITPEIMENMKDEMQEVEERMELDDTRRTLRHAMEQLKQEYREVLYLRYFEALSAKEAAKIMKCSEKKLTNLAYQARQQLKKILEKEGFSIENI